MSETERLHRDWVRQWFEKARHDIGSARRLISADEAFADAVCFHAQQCAEKCLKGYLSWQQQVFEKTHDLLELLGSCQQMDDEFATLTDDCKSLTLYAVEVRYPGDIGEPTEEEAAAALDATARIRRFTRERIPFDVP